MPVIHSFSFTPAVDCTLIVTATAGLYSRRASGINGNTRLYITQGGNTTFSAVQSFPAGESSRVLAHQAQFSVTGGSSVTVGLDATAPGVGGYTFTDVLLQAEQIKR